ncbi:hypothetical protein [Kineococcus rubinsiae]|uniref:hypothetical protein n=1 Tax=Kineococcus rubinsiae TaxID=2609562 RepID=UPI0014309EE8|nr:hypothetical protein [Kineococcus rubinsiae]NIZ92273.1 hypothetical protein [Kineococcus rubinsiae]
MKINKRNIAAGTIGAVAASGLGLVMLGAPLASAATSTTDGSSSTATTATGVSGRLQAITDALKGLVTDGTLTQQQADTVASTLGSSDALRGGRGGGRGLDLDAAATAIGISADDLRTALQADGATPATVAAAHDVDEQTLVDALVAAGKTRAQQAVTDGRLTQAQADQRIADLPARVATAVDAEFTGGHGGSRGDDSDSTSGSTSSSASASTSSSTSTSST